MQEDAPITFTDDPADEAAADEPVNLDAATSWASALGGGGAQQTGNDSSEAWEQNRMMAAYALWQQQRQLPWNATNGSVAPEGASPPADAQDSWSWAWPSQNSHDSSGSAPSWGETPHWPVWSGQLGEAAASAEPAEPSSTIEEGAAAMAEHRSTSEAEDRTHNFAMNLLRQMKGDGVGADVPENNDEEEENSDEDDGLAEELSSAVALFLAGGGDAEESDAEAEEHPAKVLTSASSPAAELLHPAATPSVPKSDEMSLPSLPVAAASAAPFVPAAAASMAAANLVAATRSHAKKAAAAPISLSSAIPTTPSTASHPRGISLADALAGHPTSNEQAQEVATMPTQEALNDFMNVLRRRSLPLELDSEEKLAAFKATITATLLALYKDRIRPTLGLLQRRLRDRGCAEAALQALLSVCARDAPDVFQIQPPMRGEQPTIYLSKEPVGFEGFVDVEAAEEQPQPQSNASSTKQEAWEAFEEFLRDDKLLLPPQLNQAALVLRDKVPRFTGVSLGELEYLVRLAIGKRRLLAYCGDGLRPARVVRSLTKQRNQERLSSNVQGAGPATPGALLPRGAQTVTPLQTEGQPGSKSEKIVEERFEKPAAKPAQVNRPELSQPVSPVSNTSETIEKNDRVHDSEAGKQQTKGKENASVPGSNRSSRPGPAGLVLSPKKQDVSGLLNELMLAFPHGMRFNQLKHHLKELNDGSFSETAYTCNNLAHVPETTAGFDFTHSQKAREIGPSGLPAHLRKKGSSKGAVNPTTPIGSKV